ncbi:helix-turn-helix domain-containing protein [Kitasatospora griseola]|uniref:helix-turn-helix domain-containing protein n=1 Tax=Kitasatospora griseola TaxID=2064 RepID=UPI0037F87356
MRRSSWPCGRRLSTNWSTKYRPLPSCRVATLPAGPGGGGRGAHSLPRRGGRAGSPAPSGAAVSHRECLAQRRGPEAEGVADVTVVHLERAVGHVAHLDGLPPQRLARRHRGDVPFGARLQRRLLRARELLETTALTVDQVADRSGLGSGESLRQHLNRQLGMTPAAYRSAFAHRANVPTAAGS